MSLTYFKLFTSNVFLRNDEAYKLALLYLERKIIYLSRTYGRFILLAYSVFLKKKKELGPHDSVLHASWFAKPVGRGITAESAKFVEPPPQKKMKP